MLQISAYNAARDQHGKAHAAKQPGDIRAHRRAAESRRESGGYVVGAPDAILVRSQDMHGMEIPASVRAIGRAGAINAALFLADFVPPGTPWLHIDLYAWNDETREQVTSKVLTTRPDRAPRPAAQVSATFGSKANPCATA